MKDQKHLLNILVEINLHLFPELKKYYSDEKNHIYCAGYIGIAVR